MLNEQWGTIAAAAAILDVSTKTIRRRISDGSIEARRFGPRLVRVNLAALADSGRPMQYLRGDA
ncbi:excisionase family DNA-binding protein [Microbacterium sp. MYb66]|uniref:excisionase family DNA-binding protein n=1 Tax=Microbacterium sp. MYb66 TaxID=1848692 RepID=UPI000D0008CF|nr:excisionase family DNA-binding protein [Microbacterium sp. MYb66]PRA83506.1 DNA-binding protein [Microbacterium sp. MYb66]